MRKRRKRSRSETSDDTNSGENASSSRRQKSKKQKALVQSEYEEFTKKSTQESTSLLNETLTSLKSSEKASPINKIAYNKFAVRGLTKLISRGHVYKHQKDLTCELKCHTLSTESCSTRFQKGPFNLSPDKLYSLLYLSLLIIKDNIQLADLCRFVKEGRLSFNQYSHLFPEDCSNKFLNFSNNSTQHVFSNKKFRTTSADLAKCLKVSTYLQTPNLVELAQRYCRELNLPGEIYAYVRNLISKTAPKLVFSKNSTIIPNYEGRVMSLIVFVIKLLFGLDGETEFEFSKYSGLVNELSPVDSQMFDIIKWLKYLEYRSYVIEAHYFPLSFFTDAETDSDLFVRHLITKNLYLDQKKKLTNEMEAHKDLLDSIIKLQGGINSSIEFAATLTPFSGYLKEILNSRIPEVRNYLTDILNYEWSNSSMNFLMLPNKFLELVNNNRKMIVNNGGKNDSWEMTVLENVKVKNTLEKRRENKLINIKLIPHECDRNIKEIISHSSLKSIAQKEMFTNDYHEIHKIQFRSNVARVKKISSRIVLQATKKDLPEHKCYTTHFNPYERFWMTLKLNFECQPKIKRQEFFQQYPHSFRIMFSECAKIVEQPVHSLLEEYQMTELYLVYKTNYRIPGIDQNKVVGKVLQGFVEKASDNW